MEIKGVLFYKRPFNNKLAMATIKLKTILPSEPVAQIPIQNYLMKILVLLPTARIQNYSINSTHAHDEIKL